MNREAEEELFVNDYVEFLRDTINLKELQLVITGHLYIENGLDKLLKSYIKYPDYIYNKNFMFNSKLKWALALGLIPKDCEHAYSRINTIRNKFGHNLNYKLTEDDFSSLKGVLNEEMRRQYKSQYNHITDKHSLSARFRNLISLLWSELKWINIQVKNANNKSNI